MQVDRPPPQNETGPVVFGHLPPDRRVLHAEAHARPVRGQPDGRADPQGHHAVLRLRAGEAEGPLPQHALLQAADQPEHHLLQLHSEGRAPGQEDHRARLQLLLHPRQDGPGPQKQSVPRLQGGTLQEPCVLW